MKTFEFTDAEAIHLLDCQISWFYDILDDAAGYFSGESVSGARAELAMQLDLLARFGCSLGTFIEMVNCATAGELETMAKCLGYVNVEEMDLVGTYIKFLANLIA